jgi:hypothetical protein
MTPRSHKVIGLGRDTITPTISITVIAAGVYVGQTIIASLSSVERQRA